MPGKRIRNTKILSFITVILVFIMGLISIYSLNRLEKSIVDSLHTKDILQASDELYNSIIETESSLRGFLLSRNDSYQSRYLFHKDRIPRLLDSLKRMTTDNPMQQKNLRDLSITIKERIIMFEDAYAYSNQFGDMTGYMANNRIQQAVDVSDRIKAQIAVVNNGEQEILKDRTKGLFRYLTLLPGFFIFIALISFGTAGLAFYSIYQYNTAQKISDRQIAAYQNQLKEQIQRLNVSNDELAQFAYVASHDLQEPLRKITAFSELLNEQYKSTLQGEGQLYLQRISGSAGRMRNLITDLLNYSRVSRANAIEDIDLNVAYNQVKDDLEILINEKKAVLTSDMLPVVKGDLSEYRQLFQNLLTNALKFSKDNQAPIINIKVEAANTEDLRKLPDRRSELQYLAIRFEDNGIGFEPEYADKIFVIFKRLHGRDSYEGTGIGLAICKKITEKYGGTIYAQSNPGNGAVFHVILPKA